MEKTFENSAFTINIDNDSRSDKSKVKVYSPLKLKMKELTNVQQLSLQTTLELEQMVLELIDLVMDLAKVVGDHLELRKDNLLVLGGLEWFQW